MEEVDGLRFKFTFLGFASRLSFFMPGAETGAHFREGGSELVR
jgi:hypothetical protein